MQISLKQNITVLAVYNVRKLLKIFKMVVLKSNYKNMKTRKYEVLT